MRMHRILAEMRAKRDFTPYTPTQFEAGITYSTSIALLSSSASIVAFRDNGDSDKGKACVISISYGTITANTPADFASGGTVYFSIAQLSDSAAIVCYSDSGDSTKGKARILTVSGTTVTAETAAEFEAGAAQYISVCALSATKALVTYRDNGDSGKGKACILDISGTTVTPGTPSEFEAGATLYTCVSAYSATTAIVAYQDYDDSAKGKLAFLSVSGSTITPATPVEFQSAGTAAYFFQCSLSALRGIIAYGDTNDSTKGKAKLLTIVDTTITPGSAVQFEAGGTQEISVAAINAYQAAVLYADGGDSNKGKICLLNIPSSTIVPGAPIIFESGATKYTSTAKITGSKMIVAYMDDDDSDKGKAVIINVG